MNSDKKSTSKPTSTTVKSITVKSDIVKSDIVKSNIVKSDIVKSDIVKTDIVKSDIVKSNIVKSDIVKSGMVKSEKTGQPYVRILEQPRSRGLRFRYQCEGRRSGSIVGTNSISSKKTYPTIEIVNSQGPCFVVVSCVTKDPPYRPHPHSIDGRGKEFSHGICYMRVPAGQTVIVFPRITIQCVKKNYVLSALEERKRLKVDPFMTGYPDSVKSIDLSCVRLCFQVFLEGEQEGVFDVALKPVVTQPIYDKKSSVEFVILWISHASASVAGGKVICILCDKVVKEDIQVIFFCEKSGWEAMAEFTCPFFHKQVAVILKTPPYSDQEVTEPVQVKVMLRRPSNGTTSVPVPFELLPVEATNRDMARAKRRRLCTTPRKLVDQHKLMEEENRNVNGASTAATGAVENHRVPQTQHSVIPNRQSIKAEESSMSITSQDDLQVPLPVPKTPVEFKQILDNYMHTD